MLERDVLSMNFQLLRYDVVWIGGFVFKLLLSSHLSPKKNFVVISRCDGFVMLMYIGWINNNFGLLIWSFICQSCDKFKKLCLSWCYIQIRMFYMLKEYVERIVCTRMQIWSVRCNNIRKASKAAQLRFAVKSTKVLLISNKRHKGKWWYPLYKTI